MRMLRTTGFACCLCFGYSFLGIGVFVVFGGGSWDIPNVSVKHLRGTSF